MTAESLSRREFLKAAGITLGASALACTGAGCTGQSSEDDSGDGRAPGAEIETPSFVYGEEETVNAKILIAYATRTGSTVGVAAAIGETLAQRGFSVAVKPIQENPTPDGYAAVILGSAVNGANWLPEAVEYVKDHQQALNQMPLALFCVHIMNMGDDEKSRNNRLAYLNSVRPLLPPAEEAFFAGIGMNPEEESRLVRWIYRTFKIGGEGDCRDWNKIRGWAQTLSLLGK